MPASETGVVVRWSEFDRLTALRGWDSDAERARQLGISHAHLTNMRAGRTGPGAKFIGQCLRLLGGQLYDVLFDRKEEAA